MTFFLCLIGIILIKILILYCHFVSQVPSLYRVINYLNTYEKSRKKGGGE